MLRLDDLTLEQVIFEVRFPNGFLYWDRAGSIWQSISNKWPNLIMKEVNTERARFSLSDNDIEMSFSHNRIGSHQNFPRRLDTFKSFTKDSFDIVFNAIEINSFSRVGNRYKYFFAIEDQREVVDFFVTNQLFFITERIKGIGRSIREPSIRFIVENDDISIAINVAYFRRNLELSIPKPLEVDTSKFIRQGISIDLDFFSAKNVNRGIFDAEDFINTHEKSSQRVIEKIFA